jgi:hypothetical protein
MVCTAESDAWLLDDIRLKESRLKPLPQAALTGRQQKKEKRMLSRLIQEEPAAGMIMRLAATSLTRGP